MDRDHRDSALSAGAHQTVDRMALKEIHERKGNISSLRGITTVYYRCIRSRTKNPAKKKKKESAFCSILTANRSQYMV